MSIRRFDMRFVSAAALVGLIGLCSAIRQPANAETGAVNLSSDSSHAALTIGIHRVDAELATSPEARARGLMQRTFMASGKGMLFVFPSDDSHCMWMKNTLIPLSVAFIDAKGKILNIEDMEPETENNHCARAPARYALEVNMGWFAVRGIKPGMSIGGLERIGR